MTVTLITGSNKGIGYETAKQLKALGHTVYIGARDFARGKQAARALGARFVQLDVTDDASVTSALATIAADEGHLDVLVHNAGVQEYTLDGATGLRAFDTNVVGIVRVTQAALPLLHKSSNPNVVTVSSSVGSFWAVTNPERPEFGLPLALVWYSASKAAATMVTVHYAKAHPEVKFNALEPGYTDTDMTAGSPGGRSPEETAQVIVRLATLGPDGPTGTFQDENGELAW